MSDFSEKFKKAKQHDEDMRTVGASMDPVELKKQHDKMDYIFTVNISKKIFDYGTRQDLISDFKILSLAEKKAFLIKEFGINPDNEMLDLRPGELKYQAHDEAKRDLKTPVCRKCGKAHNPFETCLG